MKGNWKWMGFLLALVKISIATEPCSLRMAYQDRVVDGLIVASMEQNFFAKQGITVQGSLFRSGPECSEALLQGSVDVATLGDASAVLLIGNHGNRFEAILAHGGGEKRHRIVAQKEIRSLQDLQGKRVAVKFGTSTHAGLMQFLQLKGLRWNLVDMAPNLQMTALVSGEVSAIVASEPTPSQAEKKLGVTALADLGNLENLYPVLLVANKQWKSRHLSCVNQLEKALQNAEEWVRSHPDILAKSLAERSGISIPLARKSMALHDYSVKKPKAFQSSLDRISEFLRRAGYLD